MHNAQYSPTLCAAKKSRFEIQSLFWCYSKAPKRVIQKFLTTSSFTFELLKLFYSRQSAQYSTYILTFNTINQYVTVTVMLFALKKIVDKKNH